MSLHPFRLSVRLTPVGARRADVRRVRRERRTGKVTTTRVNIIDNKIPSKIYFMINEMPRKYQVIKYILDGGVTIIMTYK